MSINSIDLWTIAIGILCNASCALLGCYLVLRRVSLLGDAISHAILPGIAIAFLLTGRVNGIAIVVGAMCLGVLTALLTETIHKVGQVQEDSSMGVVFTSLFALGVILISNAAEHTDLDPGCVLYGLIEMAPLDTVFLLGIEVPRAVLTLVPVLVATICFVWFFWKELKISTFDPALATSMGFSATLMHYLLMAMTAGVTVASFEAVGAVLVVAMLIVPAATAQLLSDRLVWMLLWATLMGTLSAVLGYIGAVVLNTSVAGMMAVAAGGLFTLAVFLAPRHGVISRIFRNLRLALRIACEDVLGVLYRREESHRLGELPQPELSRAEAHSINDGLVAWLTVPLLRWQGTVQVTSQGTIGLTDEGRRRAQFLVRSHRLWEAYLDKNTDLPLDHLHDPAMRMEHFIDDRLQHELESQLDRTDRDPHGREIPPAP